MTDKEAIICKYKFQNKEKFNGKPYCLCHNELCEDLSFACDHNCQIYEDFKQLVRKTQECRELEIKNVTLQNRYQQVAGATTEAARYRKALEEIKEVLKEFKNDELCFYNDIEDCENCDMKDDCNFLRKVKILNIINKAEEITND